ncbi:hypothetical protein FBU30_003272 [Linnemannia zychae]|nr:hypothetical protein FBU30_003272 [Linnemannia zychae]
MKKQKKRPYRRTIFPQDSFRYQKFVGPNIKDVVPDFFLHELEEFEDVVTDAFEALQERIEKQQNLQKLQMDQENQNEEIMIKDEEIAIYPMSVWDPEIARLQMLMDVWNNGAPLKKREDSNEATDGKAIEEVNGQDEKDKEEEEEDVDQEEEEEDEAMILETESVQGVRGLNLKIWQGAIETDPWVATTWRSNRDRIISWRIPPSIHILGDSLLLEIEIVATPVFQQSNHVSQWTREMIVNVALRQQQPSSILLTDRIPITWRAMQVKIPAWVPTGIYHIRVRGVSDDGSRFVEDLSQPFAVLSDPYIYS